LKDVRCDGTQITNLDVTNKDALTQLICSNNKQLTRVYCKNNKLNYLDITSDTSLRDIDCSHNQLISLDLTNDTAIRNLSCNYNKLTFATLPLKEIFWTSYVDTPQGTVPIAKALMAGYELDLSSQNNINGNITNYSWKTLNGITLTEGIDYTIAEGVTVFLKARTDSVYCEMTNLTFPDFFDSNSLKTTNTKVVLYNSIEKSDMNVPELYSFHKTIYINSLCRAQLDIFDINGRRVISKFINRGANAINMKNSGIYFVKYTGDGSSFARKVFVQ
jgi:hypothetical protein